MTREESIGLVIHSHSKCTGKSFEKMNHVDKKRKTKETAETSDKHAGSLSLPNRLILERQVTTQKLDRQQTLGRQGKLREQRTGIQKSAEK